jgi:hypothetical protein
MGRRTMKLILGGVCVLFNLAVLLSGVWLIAVCVKGLGEGEASATVKLIGTVTGLNGPAIGTFMGVAMVIISMMYTHKAYREALKSESASLPDIVRHHSPLL